MTDNKTEWQENTDNVAVKAITVEDLISNIDSSLDTFLLNSPLHSQEDRELIMDTMYHWLKQRNDI